MVVGSVSIHDPNVDAFLAAGHTIEEFRRYDQDGDGVLDAHEQLRRLTMIDGGNESKKTMRKARHLRSCLLMNPKDDPISGEPALVPDLSLQFLA